MRILLDTHVFLWFISGDKRLSGSLREIIQEAANDVFLSAASLWEIIIKHQLSRLPLPASPDVYVPLQREQHGIASLSIDELSVAKLATLPQLHRDPFDRILIAQALHHDMVLATVDAAVRQYPVRLAEV